MTKKDTKKEPVTAGKNWLSDKRSESKRKCSNLLWIGQQSVAVTSERQRAPPYRTFGRTASHFRVHSSVWQKQARTAKHSKVRAEWLSLIVAINVSSSAQRGCAERMRFSAARVACARRAFPQCAMRCRRRAPFSIRRITRTILFLFDIYFAIYKYTFFFSWEWALGLKVVEHSNSNIILIDLCEKTDLMSHLNKFELSEKINF